MGKRFKSLSSILTISKDTIYGKIVRINYQNKAVRTYYLPSFVGTMETVRTLMPDIFILDFRAEEFIAAQSFLQELIKLKTVHSRYSPDLFLSQTSAAILRQISHTTAQLLSRNPPQRQEHELMTLEAFQIDSLLHLLAIAIQYLS